MHRWLKMGLCGLGGLCLLVLMTACDLRTNTVDGPAPTQTPYQLPPPTPSADVIRVSGTATGGARLHVTVPSVTLLSAAENPQAQLFIVLADPDGTYSYLLTPANQPGISGDEFSLREYPLEISVQPATDTIKLWLLAVQNNRYAINERFGVDALAASLGFGFHNWLTEGDAIDDPLAAVVSASDGALNDWFANIDVLGQMVLELQASPDADTELTSQRSPDGGLNAVYSVNYVSEQTIAEQATPTPPIARAGYILRLDETFEGDTSPYTWYEGQDSTYRNTITDGAYQIELLEIVQREFGLSWGSLENAIFENYIVEAEVELVEEGVQEARYGIWFNYKDDYNFMYFGVSNQGEYRAAVIQRNSNRVELQDWTPHPAVRRGAASNTLTVRSTANGDIALSINGEQVATFNNRTFTNGSIAFFCYAESVPATCRLDRLRIWERGD